MHEQRETLDAGPVPSDLGRDVARVEVWLGPLPPPGPRPALVVASGLPGSGKSYFCRRLMERWPLVRLESDAVRQLLFASPTYSAEESGRLFAVLHAVLERLLRRGHAAILDATNLREAHRRRLYAIAEGVGARLILLRIMAPTPLVRQRLQARAQRADPQDRSQADLGVYQRLRRRVQAIRRPHLVVDTSQDLEPFVQEVVRLLAEGREPG